MKRLTATLCLVTILACTTNAMAERCLGISPWVFCDDFDLYCVVDPPLNPGEECDGDLPDPEDENTFLGNWPRSDGICSVDAPHVLWTKPDIHHDYASVMVTQERGVDKVDPDAQRLARHVHDMTTEIEDNPLNPDHYGGINGSGEILLSTDPGYVDPDTINTILKGQTDIYNGKLDDEGILHCGAYSNFTYYTEINLEGDRAPTNFEWHNCYAEYHDHGGSPHQLMATTDINPDPSTPWHHASFAFGLVAHFDEPPGTTDVCNIGTGRKPTAWRAFVYDGKEWQRLKAPDFGLPIPDHADFYPWMEWNRLRFFIGTDNIEVRLYNARAEALYSSEGVCGLDGCNSKRCFGGLNHWQKDCSIGQVTCPPSQGTCVSGYCDGGTNHAGTCTQTCPDGICNEEGVCEGGANGGQPCDCPSAPPTIAQPYFVATVPRVYKGPFNTIALGAGKGVDQEPTKCEQIRNGGPDVCVGGINNGLACATVDDCPPSIGTCVSGYCDGGTNDEGACTQTCPDGVCNAQGQCNGGANAGQPCDCPAFEECLKAGSTFDMNMAVDDVILWDGVFVPVIGQGACCRAETRICEDGVEEASCSLPDIWHEGQDCVADEIVCCADPFADADNDDDVDMGDFGIWQACFSGSGNAYPDGCECFDRHPASTPDGDVDGDDFTAFSNCWSGPTVAALPSCDD